MSMLFKRIKDWATSITAFRTGDVIPVDGPSGTAKMTKDNLLKETAENAQKWNAGAAQELFIFRTNVGITTSNGVGSTAGVYGVRVNGRCQAVVSCKAGDAFIVEGVGSDSYRLWAFTDENREIVSVAVANLDGSNGIRLVAEVDGFLYVNCASTLYHLYKIAQKITENKSVDFEAEFSKFGKHDITNFSENYINTNVNIGSSVSLTPSSSSLFIHQVIDCNAGDRFFVFGSSGSNPRLWAFIDSDEKLVNRYFGSDGTVSEIEVDAPVDGKLILNAYKDIPYGVYKIDVSSALVDKENETKSLTKSLNDLNEDVGNLSRTRLRNWNINGYIKTSDAVGTTISLQVLESYYFCLVCECSKDDEFIVVGSGGSNARLWCFVDSSNKIMSQAAAGIATVAGIKVAAPANGKLIVNSSPNVPHDVIVIKSSELYEKINGLTEDVENLSLVDIGTWVERSYIKTNLAYGSTVDLTPLSSGSFRHKIIDCNVGDVIYLKAAGGEAPRSWAYIDSNGALVSRPLSGILQSTLLVFPAPCNGKLIVNDAYSSYAFTRKANALAKQDEFLELEGRVADIEDKLPPNTIFEIKHELPDVSEELSLFDYSTSAQEKTILEQVYAAFDGLVTNYPDYVTRVDAAEVAGETYPEYANGYDGVPAYKMYMYKFESSFIGAGNENGMNPKKKLFIIAGQHGDETAAPTNAYIFAKRLCEAAEDNFFKLHTSYDVYIIPCVNGFGLHKLTRVNGNGVDLNRNYPIEQWHPTGQPGDSNYSGASAGSEFETKVVCACFNSIMPDMAIDHHNYSDYSGGQFYMTGRQMFLMKIGHQFLEDCSFTFIKNLPNYFGTSYKLFKLNTNSGMPAKLAPGTDATADVWFAEAGAKCCMTVEISRCINFYQGSAVSTGQGKNLYGSDTFAVGQYTLSGILFKSAGYLCAKIP